MTTQVVRYEDSEGFLFETQKAAEESDKRWAEYDRLLNEDVYNEDQAVTVNIALPVSDFSHELIVVEYTQR